MAILLEKYNNLTEKKSNSPFIPQDPKTFKYNPQLYQGFFTCQQVPFPFLEIAVTNHHHALKEICNLLTIAQSVVLTVQ